MLTSALLATDAKIPTATDARESTLDVGQQTSHVSGNDHCFNPGTSNITLVVEKETRVGVFQRDVPGLGAGCGRQWAGPVHDAERQVRADHHQIHAEREGGADWAWGEASGQVLLQASVVTSSPN